MKKKNTRRGFTLIELLIAVLIIGILAAVAVPMYQRAVYKSRFSKLMLPAKTLASANEAFFLGNGEYATTVAALDVGGNTASLLDGSTVDLQDTDDASFVRLSNAEVPHARYVVYQQKSANFAGATMCEAEGEDDKATWLCDKGLNGTIVEDAQGNSGTGNWTAYLLTGTIGQDDQFGTGDSNDTNDEPEVVCPTGATCDEQGNVTGCSEGYIVNGNACETDPTYAQLQALAAAKCPDDQSRYVCTIKNGTLSRCDTNYGAMDEQGECVSNGTLASTYESIYNPDGTEKRLYVCNGVDSGHCFYAGVVDYVTGTVKNRKCADNAAISKDATCANGYAQGEYLSNSDITYDSHRNDVDYNSCSAVNDQGICTAYSSMAHYDRTYDGDTQTGYVSSSCATISGTTCVNNNYKNTFASKTYGTFTTKVSCCSKDGTICNNVIPMSGTCTYGNIRQTIYDKTTKQYTYKDCTSYNTIDWENATCN